MGLLEDDDALPGLLDRGADTGAMHYLTAGIGEREDVGLRRTRRQDAGAFLRYVFSLLYARIRKFEAGVSIYHADSCVDLDLRAG